mmetsp:Transcript_45091/g.105329  ORF Transcript_45091/g.105329 Transcript_45091/m.105329 type:complete len:309 (+) Transcript_45091:335-1261(+)
MMGGPSQRSQWLRLAQTGRCVTSVDASLRYSSMRCLAPHALPPMCRLRYFSGERAQASGVSRGGRLKTTQQPQRTPLQCGGHMLVDRNANESECVSRSPRLRGKLREALHDGLVEEPRRSERLLELRQLLPRESSRELERDARRERRHVRPQLQHRVRVVRLDHLAAAVVQPDLQARRRQRSVDVELGRFLCGRRGGGGARCLAAHRPPRSRERLERRRRRLVRLGRTVDQVNIALGAAVVAHELFGHSAFVDIIDERQVLWVLHIAKRAVVNGETVLPECNRVLLWLRRRLFAFGVCAAERLSGAGE